MILKGPRAVLMKDCTLNDQIIVFKDDTFFMENVVCPALELTSKRLFTIKKRWVEMLLFNI